jgi:hypothetical protein
MNEVILSADARVQLLAWARRVLETYLRTGKLPEVPRGELAAELLAPGAAFVTLHQGEDLRGCIGTFQADQSLAEAIREMAVSAATRDPRFRPVPRGELEHIRIEISVLSSRRPVEHPLRDIQVGTHGIYVTRAAHRGVLLPQVATEQGWDVLTFVEQTCRKAGLPADAWRASDTRIEVFTAQVFGEPER